MNEFKIGDIVQSIFVCHDDLCVVYDIDYENNLIYVKPIGLFSEWPILYRFSNIEKVDLTIPKLLKQIKKYNKRLVISTHKDTDAKFIGDYLKTEEKLYQSIHYCEGRTIFRAQYNKNTLSPESNENIIRVTYGDFGVNLLNKDQYTKKEEKKMKTVKEIMLEEIEKMSEEEVQKVLDTLENNTKKLTNEVIDQVLEKVNYSLSPEVDKIFVNEAKRTIAIKWTDGKVTKAICDPQDKFDLEKGVLVALAKRTFSFDEITRYTNWAEKVYQKGKKKEKKTVKEETKTATKKTNK